MASFPEPILHVDADSFFVAVERLRRPELRDRPVLVGGDGPRSVVAAASYEARRHGARSAMPMAMAKRLCPRAVVVAPDHGEYRRVSEALMAVLGEVTSRLEPISIDEAFLDLGGIDESGGAVAVAERLRRSVQERVGVTVSVGIAATKLVAKMASRDAKPDGLLLVPAGTEADFMHPKPVRALWGVGEATLARLEELGVRTIGDLAGFPRATLVRRLGEGLGGALWDRAHAVDDREVEADIGVRSISVEETYPVDLLGDDAVDRALLAHAAELTRRLREAGVAAGTITVKVRFGDFTTVSRSHTPTRPVVGTTEVLDEARRLLAAVDRRGQGVRLLGIAGSALVPADTPRQLALGEVERRSV
ncbi:MAG TPA: DNA polymerase IV, partial [Acidimicrobiia bacterium]|nr:DNA polymerase IV [Acidimicrobiia bacterium]